MTGAHVQTVSPQPPLTDERAASRLPNPAIHVVRFAQAAMLLAAAIAACGLVGGWSGKTLLREWIPGRPGMLFTAAVALALLSSSALLQVSGRPRTLPAIGSAFAWLALILTILSAGDHLFWNVGIEGAVSRVLRAKIDAAAFDEQLRGGAVPFFIAVALLFFRRRGRFAVGIFQTLTSLAIMISLLAIIGHTYDVSSFFRWTTTLARTAIAFPSEVAFSILGFALFAAWPELPLTRVVL